MTLALSWHWTVLRRRPAGGTVGGGTGICTDAQCIFVIIVSGNLPQVTSNFESHFGSLSETGEPATDSELQPSNPALRFSAYRDKRCRAKKLHQKAFLLNPSLKFWIGKVVGLRGDRRPGKVNLN